MTDHDPARQGPQNQQGAPAAYPQQPYQQNPYQNQGQGQGGYGQQNPKTNVLAIVSLVSSILSSFVFSIVAIVTGHISLRQIKRTGEQGKVMAIIGLVLGYLGLLGAIALVVFFIAAIAAGGFAYDQSYGTDGF
jgi:hypothetical protein